MSKHRRVKRKSLPSSSQESTADTSTNAQFSTPAKWILLALSIVFLLFAAMLINTLEREPRRLARAAQSWIEVPCSIHKIEVESHSMSAGIKSTRGSIAYSPLVEFEYRWQGKSYISTRFWFGSTLWNSQQDVRDIIAPYRQATEQICLVDPSDPTQAVLTRSLFLRPPVSAAMLTGLVTVSSLIAGSFVFLGRTMGRAQPGSSSVSKSTASDTAADDVFGASEPKAGHLWIATLVWNGILGTIAHFSWVGGAPLSFFIVFLGIFWLVGLGLAAGALLKTLYPRRVK